MHVGVWVCGAARGGWKGGEVVEKKANEGSADVALLCSLTCRFFARQRFLSFRHLHERFRQTS
eukprot:4021550-Pleurochrysis_carterae.AAC.1